MTTGSSMSPSRTPIFDWLRHGLAFIVIFSHCIPLLRGTNDTELLMLLTDGQLTFGTLAVFVFFALSGYLITSSWQREPNIRTFLIRRLARILPAWGSAMIFGAVIVLPLVTGQWPHDREVLVGFLPLTWVLPHNPYPWKINAVLWTIPYEVLCYLLVVLAGILHLVTKRGIIAILVMLGSIAFFLHSQFGTIPLTVLLVIAFWAGALAQYIVIPRQLRWLHALMIAALPLIVAHHLVLILLPLYVGWLLMWLPQCRARPLPVDWSYGLYVYTFPIQQGIVAVLGNGLSPLLLATLSLCLSLPICALSWHWLEAPVLRWVRPAAPMKISQKIAAVYEQEA
jgi:peptidoglycan/LPS O-acetylase OafA/YrhL